MDFDPRDPLILLLTLALAAGAARWLRGRREVKVVQPSDYRDGHPRTFVRVKVVSDGTGGGTFLADADTGRPLQFVGCVASQIQSRFLADSRRAQVAVLLDGVKIDYGEGACSRATPSS